MSFFESIARAFRRKSAANNTEQLSLDQLVYLLGLHGVEAADLSEATYFACLKVLSESIGKLPLKVQQYTPDQGIRIAREHPWYRCLNERPNRHMTASVFWAAMELCRNHHGNAYAIIDTRNPRRPQLWPVDPTTVRVYYDNARLVKDVPDVYYQISAPTGQITLGSEEVLHFKSHHTEDGLVGVSVREQLRATISGNIKAQSMLNKMYDSGMTAKAVLQYTGSINDESVKRLVAGVTSYATSSTATDTSASPASGKANIIPLPVGFSLTPLNMKLADSQFLEVKQYSALQIASAFGVKPYQVGDYTKSSYASAEAQQLSFLVDTLLYIVKQYEEEIGYKLLTDSEEAAGYHVKFNTGVILRADQQTQISTLQTAVSGFLMTPNEAREKLDLPAKDGGDQLIGNGSTIPITAVGAQWEQEPNLDTGTTEAPDTTGADGDDDIPTEGKEEEKVWLKSVIVETFQELLG